MRGAVPSAAGLAGALVLAGGMGAQELECTLVPPEPFFARPAGFRLDGFRSREAFRLAPGLQVDVEQSRCEHERYTYRFRDERRGVRREGDDGMYASALDLMARLQPHARDAAVIGRTRRELADRLSRSPAPKLGEELEVSGPDSFPKTITVRGGAREARGAFVVEVTTDEGPF